MKRKLKFIIVDKKLARGDYAILNCDTEKHGYVTDLYGAADADEYRWVELNNVRIGFGEQHFSVIKPVIIEQTDDLHFGDCVIGVIPGTSGKEEILTIENELHLLLARADQMPKVILEDFEFDMFNLKYHLNSIVSS
jgi:hypothetical protein